MEMISQTQGEIGSPLLIKETTVQNFDINWDDNFALNEFQIAGYDTKRKQEDKEASVEFKKIQIRVSVNVKFAIE